jgi:uncharacterized protein (TIGR03086 family)
MDATTALNETTEIMNGLVAGLTPDHREMRTPCEKWNVHELIEHVCQGGHGIAGGLLGEAPPEGDVDVLDDGPANGWASAQQHLHAAATPEVLTSLHQMPFGEVPGEAAMSVIVSDHLVHAWDLAQATGQDFSCSDELATFAHNVWLGLAPAEGRTGEPFADVVAVPDDAAPLAKMLAYTGRQP